jgi:hypothetical protein
MNYKVLIISVLLAGSMQHAWAMHQQQPYNGGLRRISSSVVVYQSGVQPHAAAYQGLVQQVREKDAVINTLVQNQTQQNREFNQIMTDLNELLTAQAVAIGELKEELNTLKKQVAAMEEQK